MNNKWSWIIEKKKSFSIVKKFNPEKIKLYRFSYLHGTPCIYRAAIIAENITIKITRRLASREIYRWKKTSFFFFPSSNHQTFQSINHVRSNHPCSASSDHETIFIIDVEVSWNIKYASFLISSIRIVSPVNLF